MSLDFEFPIGDEARLRSDCKELQEIILQDLAAHITWLRALRAAASVEQETVSAIAWDESHTQAILKQGLYGAYESGSITTSQLRRLSVDPDLLERVGDRLFSDGDESVWHFGAALDLSDVDPKTLVQSFIDALHATYAGGKPAPSTPPPAIESTDLRQTLRASWVPSAGGSVYRITVPVAAATTLSLRWKSRTWGKLRVQRPWKAPLEVVARTGVFLGSSLPESLMVRSAAATDSVAAPRAVGIHLFLVQDNVCVDIVIATSGGPAA